jgi:hypothetical protein
MPMPLPEPGGVSPALPLPLPRLVSGSEGDDRLELPAGGVAFGRGGNDVFVLASAGGSETPERLGFIGDFDEGDQLDLSGLGADAKILGREASASPWGPDRISIDYDADGDEDGYLLVSDGKLPDLSNVPPVPMPTPIDAVRILPYDGDVPVSSDLEPALVAASPVSVEPWLG